MNPGMSDPWSINLSISRTNYHDSPGIRRYGWQVARARGRRQQPTLYQAQGKSFARIREVADFASDILVNSEADHLREMKFPLDAKYPATQISYLTALCKAVVEDLFLSDALEEPPGKPTSVSHLRVPNKEMRFAFFLVVMCLKMPGS
jgi:hypothetical protein